ncbi:MAG: protein phosphatase 2C domain-containing protein [Oscillospiraceae bacterium]|nr:protein phosphatase 2C domain-containing protein [Oscillospiraceae bacterium]MDE6658448.1 protein phosphatase 2C domain-containing protein [Oscillospiraceae bacterium]
MYEGFCHSVIGASHVAKGTVCQDFSNFQSSEFYSIAVVADGHGSKKHFRSDVGSRLAVRATLRTVRNFYRDPEEFEESFQENPRDIITKIEKQIISRWNREVSKHFRKNPVTDEEKAPFTEDQYESIRMESMYGTTLIAVVMGKDYVFGMQIGDGSLVLLDEDGEAEMPIADDESAPANLTASMCNSNAIDMFNSFYLMDNPMAVFVSTDGLFTSFRSEDDFLDYHTIIASHLEQMPDFDKVIIRNLTKRTNFGTQDDISLSCLFNKQLVIEGAESLKNQVEKNKARAEMRKAEHQAKLAKQRLKNQLRRNPNIAVEE